MGDAASTTALLRQLGLMSAQALEWHGSFIGRLAPIAAKDTRILNVCGVVDDAAPMVENSIRLGTRCKTLGGRSELIVKPGVRHHSHSLVAPSPIVSFVARVGNHGSHTVGSRVGPHRQYRFPLKEMFDV